jgi:hypothetical protein
MPRSAGAVGGFAARRTPDPGRIVDEYLIVLAAGS